jgi:DNA repair protein RadA/Sms
VTKDGAIAGPKVLEHLVDTVLYFEGDNSHAFRILRAVKNRFGSTNEIGVFEMKDTGLAAVGNPSRIFLEERPEGTSGSVVIPCLEGTRPLLLEIQALVGPSPLGMPRRTAVGVDHNRISLLVAVLGKRIGLEMGDQDIFVNVAGGLRVDEPAADLGIVCAMISSFLDRPVDKNLVVFGEVGLAGKSAVSASPELRIKEAAKLGFTLSPSKSNLEGCSHITGMELSALDSVKGLMEVATANSRLLKDAHKCYPSSLRPTSVFRPHFRGFGRLVPERFDQPARLRIGLETGSLRRWVEAFDPKTLRPKTHRR